MLERIDQRVERRGIDQPLLHEERLERLRSERHVGRHILMIVRGFGRVRLTGCRACCGARSRRQETPACGFHAFSLSHSEREHITSAKRSGHAVLRLGNRADSGQPRSA